MKRIIFFIFSITSLLFISSCDLRSVENNNAVIINEICSSNQSSLATSDYDYFDWVELYNPTEEDIFLKNYGLSDKKDNLFKFTFPSVVIKSKGYLIVYFSSESANKEKLIAGFGLSSDGETLYLTMPNRTIIEEIEFPKLDTDTVYGRYDGGYEILNPTPNKDNAEGGRYQFVSNPIFSKDSGFYNDSFELKLSTNSNAKIYYTIDSSVPTENSLEYKNGIMITNPSSNPNVLKSRTDTSARGTSTTSLVDKAFIVRAIAIGNDGNKSNIVTKSYFINLSKYQNKKVVSLVTDSKNLIDEETGIYVTGKAYNDYVAGGSNGTAPEYNWSYSGREWERDCNFSLIDNGVIDFSQDCGMRIHGYGGRDAQIKSFNIYARNCYGNKYFINPIFNNVEYTKTITLKYDRYSNSVEKYRDGFIQSLMSNENVDTQKYEMCIVFLNGEYWQTYMIMQKYDEDYIEEKYGINQDNVVMIKEHRLNIGTEEDYKDYKSLVNFAKTADFKKNKNYEKLCSMIDVDSFIDFYSTQLYINHFDFSYKKNVFIWKSRTTSDLPYEDGKWRWMLYDFDYAAVNRDVTYNDVTTRYDYKFNTFTGLFMFATDFKDDVFFHNFMESELFKERFVSRFMDLANSNFSGENVASKLEEQFGAYNTTLNAFFNNRFSYITKYLSEYIGIANNQSEIIVNTNKAIGFNSLELDSNFKGTYFFQYYLTIDVRENNYELSNLEVVNKNGSILTLRIIGDNPSITIY